MKGTIGLSNLKVPCLIGCDENEHDKIQVLLVDLKVKISFEEILKEDSIDSTVNYVLLASLCQKMAKKRPYYILESYSYETIREIFREFNLIEEVKFLVKKQIPERDFTHSFVELNVSREEFF